MNKASVIIMTKVPIPGFVKTRLETDLTPEDCAELYRCFLMDTVDCGRRSFKHSIYVAFTPVDNKNILADMLPADVKLIPQTGETLGLRMANAIGNVTHKHEGGAIVIGADIPLLQPEHLREAHNALAENDLVLGPACDGGYYLIALKRNDDRLFNNISWGTDRVLAQTLERAKKLKLSVHLLPTLNDIDFYEDLLKLGRYLKSHGSEMELLPIRTWGFLNKLGL